MMSKNIAARFYVSQTTRNAYGMSAGGKPTGTVTLQAVTRKTGDNINWAQATPSGQLTMTVNGDAMEVFNDLLGKDVSILISEIDMEAEAESATAD